MPSTLRDRLPSLLALVALLIGCRGRPRPDPTPTPPPSATVSRDASAASADAAARPEAAPREARFEVVAVREQASGQPRLRIDDLHGRVVVSATRPLAWADGDGPLALDSKLGAGLPAKSGFALKGIAGTYPDAVFAIYGVDAEARGVAFDLPVYRLTEAGWHLDRPAERRFYPLDVLPLRDRGVVVVGVSADAENALPAEVTPSMFLALQSTAAPRKLAAPNITLRKLAERDGHLFVLGTRGKTSGIFLADVVEGKGVSYYPLPGTAGCDADTLHSMLYAYGLVAANDGQAYVSAADGGERCPASKEALYQLREKKLAPSRATELAASKGSNERASLIDVGAEGTLWMYDAEGEAIWTATAGGPPRRRQALPVLRRVGASFNADYTEPVRTDAGRRDPSPCSALRVLARSPESAWMLAECFAGSTLYDVVLRLGRAQEPLVLNEAP